MFWLLLFVVFESFENLIKLKNIFLYLETGHAGIDETVMQQLTYHGGMKLFFVLTF